mmetsp:Transcript_21379/g.48178  ORF Transcript_21379/g.48178 Transcript_21379/m.48178 type:complete len:269 (-) Transcript_21379:267-1073(-)
MSLLCSGVSLPPQRIPPIGTKLLALEPAQTTTLPTQTSSGPAQPGEKVCSWAVLREVHPPHPEAPLGGGGAPPRLHSASDRGAAGRGRWGPCRARLRQIPHHAGQSSGAAIAADAAPRVAELRLGCRARWGWLLLSSPSARSPETIQQQRHGMQRSTGLPPGARVNLAQARLQRVAYRVLRAPLGRQCGPTSKQLRHHCGRRFQGVHLHPGRIDGHTQPPRPRRLSHSQQAEHRCVRQLQPPLMLASTAHHSAQQEPHARHQDGGPVL